MIVFDIKCATGHVFEGWFAGADAFSDQYDRGLVACPYCDSIDVERLPSALAIGGKAAGRNAAERHADESKAAESKALEGSVNGENAQQDSTADKKRVVETGSPAEAGLDPAKVKAMLSEMVKSQAEAVAKSDYVGGKFAEEARSMHYGEQAARPIYGETAPSEAKALREEGVPATPLLFPVKRKSDA